MARRYNPLRFAFVNRIIYHIAFRQLVWKKNFTPKFVLAPNFYALHLKMQTAQEWGLLWNIY